MSMWGLAKLILLRRGGRWGPVVCTGKKNLRVGFLGNLPVRRIFIVWIMKKN